MNQDCGSYSYHWNVKSYQDFGYRRTLPVQTQHSTPLSFGLIMKCLYSNVETTNEFCYWTAFPASSVYHLHSHASSLLVNNITDIPYLDLLLITSFCCLSVFVFPMFVFLVSHNSARLFSFLLVPLCVCACVCFLRLQFYSGVFLAVANIAFYWSKMYEGVDLAISNSSSFISASMEANSGVDR